MNEPRSPDLAFGAFTDVGPWVVEPEQMTWRRGLDAVRARLGREVPDLVRPRGLPPVARGLRIVAGLGAPLAAWAVLDRGRPGSRAGGARRFRVAFAHLGSTFVKLGQLVSAFEGVLPAEIVREFALLRDRVPPEPFSDVRAVVEADLGRRLGSVFSSFDPTPIAAASIAQVHAARLRSGEEVVVKVQRRRVARLVRQDLAVLARLSPALVGRIPVAALANPPALVELFAQQVLEELDFRLEADNMLEVAAMLAATEQHRLVVPRPHPDLVTRRVLVMERMRGFAFDDVASMRGAGIDTTEILRAGLIAFMEGALIHGVFHGDLHGGNLLVQPDGRVVAFDFGITGRLDAFRRIAFLRLLLGGTTGDVRGQLAALRDLGAFPPDTDLDAVIGDLGLDRPPIDPTTLTADELVTEMSDLVRKMLAYGARLPKDLMLFVKNLMFLNAATATLAPDLDLLGEVVAIHTYFATHHGERIVRELAIDASAAAIDMDSVRAGFMVGPEVDRLTFRDLQERREVILARMGQRRRRASGDLTER